MFLDIHATFFSMGFSVFVSGILFEFVAAEQICQVSMVAKPISGTKIVKKVIRKVIRKVIASARVASAQTIASGSVDRAKNEETPKEKTSEDIKNTEVGNNEPAAHDDCLFENVEPSKLENENIGNHKKCFQKEEQDVGDPEKHFMGSGENFPETIEPMVIDRNPVDAQEPCATNEKKLLKEELEDRIEIIDRGDLKGETIDMEDSSDQMKLENVFLDEHYDGKIEGLSDQEVREEFEGEDLADDDAPENEAEIETLEEEHLQLNAAARERKVRKDREIFVGGLGRDAVEDDVRKVFEYAGEVVEVRMHVDP